MGQAAYRKKVGSPRFRQHFAVHELEAWLFSDPSIFSTAIANEVEKVTKAPEKVNSNQPPAKFLHNLYLEKTNKTYKKVTEGNKLFAKLDPEIVRDKCPYFKLFTDDIYNPVSELTSFIEIYKIHEPKRRKGYIKDTQEAIDALVTSNISNVAQSFPPEFHSSRNSL